MAPRGEQALAIGASGKDESKRHGFSRRIFGCLEDVDVEIDRASGGAFCVEKPVKYNAVRRQVLDFKALRRQL